ncbi:MAG: ComEC/Rec2 family competence protein [Ruminococcaceae bacterium]|nr:ComEC/Rec2 family competence protein [Oscillospiraceae bacterium]
MASIKRPAVIFAAVFLLSAYFNGFNLSFICALFALFLLPVFVYSGIKKNHYRKAFFIFIIIFALLYPEIYKTFCEYKNTKTFDVIKDQKFFTATVKDISYNGKSVSIYADIYGYGGKNMGKAIINSAFPDKLCDLYDCIYFEGEIHPVNDDTIQKLSLYGNENFYYSKGCYFIAETENITVLGRLPKEKRNFVHNFYFYINDNLKNKVPIIDGTDPFSYISALLTGNRAFLTKEITQNFSASGLMPYLCISGLHISIVTGLLIFILKLFKVNRFFRFVLSLLLLIFLCFITGFSGSVMRASLMCAVLLLGELISGKYDRFAALAVALFIIILSNPYAVFDMGTQLSFLAMLGVCNSLYFTADRSFNSSKLIQYFKLTIITATVTSGFVFIPILYAFGGVYLLTPLANIPAVIFTPIMYLAVFMGIFAFLPRMLLFPFGYVFSVLTALFEKLAASFAAIPYSFAEFTCNPTLLVLFDVLIFFNILCISICDERKIFFSGVFSSTVIYISVFVCHMMTILL